MFLLRRLIHSVRDYFNNCKKRYNEYLKDCEFLKLANDFESYDKYREIFSKKN